MIEVLFIASILFSVAGVVILLGYEKYIIKNPINKKERMVSGIILLITSSLISVSCYLVLFSKEPNWLIDNVFEIFT